MNRGCRRTNRELERWSGINKAGFRGEGDKERELTERFWLHEGLSAQRFWESSWF